MGNTDDLDLPDLDPTQPVDCDDWEDIAAADLLAARMGLPVPWLDPDYTHERRVNFALLLGEHFGREHAKAIMMLDPNARRGERVREAARDGGHSRRKGPGPAALQAELRTLKEQNPSLKWTRALEKLAARHDMGRSTVYERVKDCRDLFP